MSDAAMREALARYRHQVSRLKKGYAQESYRIEQISRSPLGMQLVREVTSADVARFRDHRLDTINPRTGRPIAASTVRLDLSLLSNFFDIARIEWGLCDANPVANVRKPRCPPGRERRLSPREERLILRYAHAHSNADLYSIIVLALASAMRQGEILHLHWEHVNLKSRIAHLPDTKNGSKRDVPLSLAARDALTRLGVKRQGKVFRYTPQGLKSTWRAMLHKLGITGLHFHDLRHEAISRLFELGSLDMMEVAAISGHKSLAMLKRYTHLKAQRLVRKLEGHKSKGRQAVMEGLIPYPGAVETADGAFRVRLLDFDALHGTGTCLPSAVRAAEDALLRRLLTLMRNGQPLPAPDQYLETLDERYIVMVDPLSNG